MCLKVIVPTLVWNLGCFRLFIYLSLRSGCVLGCRDYIMWRIFNSGYSFIFSIHKSNGY